MKLIISGDWQASLTNLDRLTLVVDQIVAMLKGSQDKEQTFFLHLGDIKEHFNPVDQRVTNFLIDACIRIKNACSGMFFVRGNHDSITTQDGVASCAPLISALGANCVADDKWEKVPIRLKSWNPRIQHFALLYMVPFFRDPELQRKHFREAANDAALPENASHARILAFHNEVSGCQRSLYTKGEGFTAKEIGAPSYNIVVSGHIHLAQYIPPNIHFVGTPFAMDWGEVNTDHRVFTISVRDK